MSATPAKGLPLPLYKIQESYKDVQYLRGQKNIHKLGAWCRKQHLVNNNDGARMKIGWVIRQCNYGHCVG